MSGRKARAARGIAMAEAKRQGLWKKGEGQVFARWWRRLLAWLSPKTKRRYLDAVGRWYRRVVKSYAKQIRAQWRDPDYAAFARARRRMWNRFKPHNAAKGGTK